MASAEEKLPQLRGSLTLPEEKLEKKLIFISYTDNRQNSYLVEDLIRRFLGELNFDVRTFRDARSSDYLKAEIDRFITECPSFLAFLTKDVEEKGGEKWHPSGNIPAEIERALSLRHKVIVYHEEGVTIPSNTKSYYCRPFTNKPEKYGDLLVDLIQALRNENLLP